MTKLFPDIRSRLEKLKEINKEYALPNSTVDSGNLFFHTIKDEKDISLLLEAVDLITKALRQHTDGADDCFYCDLLAKLQSLSERKAE